MLGVEIVAAVEAPCASEEGTGRDPRGFVLLAYLPNVAMPGLWLGTLPGNQRRVLNDLNLLHFREKMMQYILLVMDNVLHETFGDAGHRQMHVHPIPEEFRKLGGGGGICAAVWVRVKWLSHCSGLQLLPSGVHFPASIDPD